MPITAEEVVISVTARLDGAKRDIKDLDSQVDTSTNKMKGATRVLEGHLDNLARTSTASFDRVGSGSKKAANDVEQSAGRIANAQRNIGRQISDVGTQLAGGQSPFLIFAQQAPQIADALADTGGKAAKVAAFFAGPWGAALLAAGSVAGALVQHLLDAGDASESFSKEQVDLARFVDTTTGAINRQTTAIQRLAAAQARQGQIEDQTRSHAAARGGAIAAVREAGGTQEPTFVAGVQVANQASKDPIRRRLRELAAEAVRTRQPINDFALAVRNAVGDRPEYRALVKTVTAQAAAAVEAAQGAERLKAEQALLSGTATKAQRALLGLGLATSSTVEKEVELATATSDVERARARLSLVQERGRSITAGDGDALKQYRADLTAARQAVNSAEAAEKAAAQSKRDHAKASREAAKEAREAARQARIAARAERDLLSLQGDLAGAKSDLTSDSRLQDQFTRDRIKLDQKGRINDLEERRDRGELTGGQFDQRKALIDQIAQARLELVNRNEAIRFANEQTDLARETVAQQQDALSARQGLAQTTRERRDIELRLLDMALEDQRLAAQNIVDLAAAGKASEQEAKIAQMRLDALPQLRELGQARIEQDNADPLDAYRNKLRRNTADVNGALQGVAVDGLETLEDGLAGIISGTDSVGDAFGRMADRIIADLARIAIERAILGLFGEGASASSAGNGVGSFLSGLFGGKREAGGPVSAGKTYLVGERGPELVKMAGSGTVIPNHRLAMAEMGSLSISSGSVAPQSRGGNIIVVQPIKADFRGARTDEQTMRAFMRYADARSQQAYKEAVKTAGKNVPGIARTFGQLHD